MEKAQHRPRIETLACPYDDCHLYSRKGVGNPTARKVYGKDRIRYLRCRACTREFSERKGTALFNTKVAEQKAISVAEHLAEGVSAKGTSRLVGVSAEAVRRLRRNLGDHAKNVHDERVKEVESTSVQMDERYGGMQRQ
jgi:transposase-like protein